MKKKELLSDTSSSASDSSDSEDGGASISKSPEPQSQDFKVNESYARRFEHNKKREELARLEEKHASSSASRKRKWDTEEESDSTSESEDEGELATEALDSEIIATINAIRSKDPRVYDENAKFYTALDEGDEEDEEETKDKDTKRKEKKEKPMHLQDYHRENLLKTAANGAGDEDEEQEDEPMTYNQEQEHLKRSILGEINAVAAAEDSSSDEDSDASADDNAFLVAKSRPNIKPSSSNTVPDPSTADRDPETFLSNFLSSRAWAAPSPQDRNLMPFDSDDSEDDTRAEAFETAYNLRFEDPAKSNEALRSHARDLAAKYSVRRDEMNPRQKRREEEKTKREERKNVEREERARLKKLRVEEVQEKVGRIKRAAGPGGDIGEDDWARLLDEEWDDGRWEVEMKRRFGEGYYAEEDVGSDLADEEGEKKKKKTRKVRKPKYDSDIDINDIVPDFEADEKPDFSLSEDEVELKTKKKHKKAKEDKKKESKRERRIIEQLVDDQLQLELNHSLPNAPKTSFKYRETSPKSFGLTARDILLAEDSQLNEFAGLKKLAAFRDPDKKRKDQKHLGKRARLRKWRMETFGDEEGVQGKDLIPVERAKREDGEEGGGNVVTGGKGRKKRRRNKKAKVESTEA